VQARPLLKSSIAGLVALAVLLQACLLAAQRSLLAAPAAGEAAFSVICTEHGEVVLETDGRPAGHRAGCAFCPLCFHFGVGDVAILPEAAGVAVSFGPSHALALAGLDHAGGRQFFVLPPSRGPPA
jgi:hypothetical protein